MRVLFKTLGGAASDALRGGRRDKLRVFRLHLLQAHEQRVVLNVRNLRAIMDVVKLLVAANLFAQGLDLALFASVG